MSIGCECAVRRESAVLDACVVAGAVALGAWVRVPLPFSPIPMTLQTLPVLLAAYAVGPGRAMAGMALYLVLGLAGAPIFAAIPFGPTWGYLLAFLAAPLLAARFRSPAWGMMVVSLAIYVTGALWLALWLRCTAWEAFAWGVVPFVPGDMVKGVLAYHAVRWVRRPPAGDASLRGSA